MPFPRQPDVKALRFTGACGEA